MIGISNISDVCIRAVFLVYVCYQSYLGSLNETMKVWNINSVTATIPFVIIFIAIISKYSPKCFYFKHYLICYYFSTVNNCFGTVCLNGGTCEDIPPSDFSCECVLGFNGTTCDISMQFVFNRFILPLQK